MALGHLHQKGIIYRDLKPENIMLNHQGTALIMSQAASPLKTILPKVTTPQFEVNVLRTAAGLLALLG